MHFPPEVLAPARRPNETFDDYARRREIGNEAVERYLKGQRFYGPEKFLRIPLVGADEKIDEMVRRGEIRVASGEIHGKKENFRLAMPKGIPYRKPKQEKS